jgi:hypothetical protein
MNVFLDNRYFIFLYVMLPYFGNGKNYTYKTAMSLY